MPSVIVSTCSENISTTAETQETISGRITNDVSTDAPPKEFACSGPEEIKKKPTIRRLCVDFIQALLRRVDKHRLSYAFALVFLVLQFWGLLYCFLKGDAAPDGPMFRLIVLCVVGQVAGWMVLYLGGMPSLVGMLMVGVAMRSTGYLVIEGAYIEVVAAIRHAALAILMTEAGLTIRAETVRKMGFHVLGMVFLPAAGEVAAVCVLSYFILGMPWLWGLLLGLVLCAVAPSVVMPSFLALRARGLGADKGIDALLLAAASLDDVVAVCLFGVVIGFIFSTGFTAMDIASHPLGLLLGVVYGIFVGFVLQWVPSTKLGHASVVRTSLLVGCGLVATFGSIQMDLIESGPTACIVAGCVAGTWWRKRNHSHIAEQTSRHVGVMWAIIQIPMFGLIGADVDVSLLRGSDVLRAGGLIVAALLVRGLVTYLLMMTTTFTWREKFFVTLAWLPKADVQAALGPLALDLARSSSSAGPEAERYATDLLLVAVVSILLTAPAGAAVITVLGRRLLKPSSIPQTATTTVETSPSAAADANPQSGVYHVRVN